jgi:ketosteroid isomerase-like protein
MKGADEMSDQTERNIEATKKGIEAFSTADIETMMSLFDDNIEWVQPGDSAISGTYHGKGELGQFFGRLAEKSATIAPRRFLADGDMVIVLSETTAGNETSEVAHVLTLRDGKTARAQVYADTTAMERVFGRKQVAAG